MSAPSTPDLASRLLAAIDTHERFYQLMLSRPRPPGGKIHGQDELRRCAADRRTVERHNLAQEHVWDDTAEDWRTIEHCGLCTFGRCCGHGISWSGTSMLDEGPALWPCDTIRDLAEVYGVPVVVAEEGQPA